MDRKRLDQQFDFIKEIDKEKFIQRQTRLSDNVRRENDAEHAWHMAIMTVLLSEYTNEKIDVLRTVTMLLIHDIVEIDAGDTYAYDEEGLNTQRERGRSGGRPYLCSCFQRISGRNCGISGKSLRREKRRRQNLHTRWTTCSRPMLNAVNNGVSWKEHGIAMSQIMKRNAHTAEGSQVLWDYAYENFFKKNIDAGNIIDDSDKEN